MGLKKHLAENVIVGNYNKISRGCAEDMKSNLAEDNFLKARQKTKD